MTRATPGAGQIGSWRTLREWLERIERAMVGLASQSTASHRRPSKKASQAQRSMSNVTIPQSKGEIIREGEKVRLRRHVPSNRATFQRWYADEEIARLLRHDLRPLNERQSRSYFDTLIMPMSARGLAFAIHDKETDRLIGTTALTDTTDYAPDARLFRIAIGEKSFWDKGMGTDATALVLDHGFERLDLQEVRLEVFAHNPRAIAVYERIGFTRTGEHYEYLGPDRPQLHVFEMSIDRDRWFADRVPGSTLPRSV